MTPTDTEPSKPPVPAHLDTHGPFPSGSGAILRFAALRANHRPPSAGRLLPAVTRLAAWPGPATATGNDPMTAAPALLPLPYRAPAARAAVRCPRAARRPARHEAGYLHGPADSPQAPRRRRCGTRSSRTVGTP